MDVSAHTPQGPAAQDQQAFRIGMDFHEAAIRAAIEQQNAQGRPITALCPMIVCYAFAAELYLKALASFGTGRAPAKGHKLHLLFGRLSEATRSAIAEVHKAKTGRTTVTLEGDLRTLTSAFVDWRYVFEGAGQQIHSNLLIALVQATYTTIRSLRPDWSVEADDDRRLLEAAQPLSMTIINLGGGTFLHVVDGTPGGQLSTPGA